MVPQPSSSVLLLAPAHKPDLAPLHALTGPPACRGPGLYSYATGRARFARESRVENSDSIASYRGTCGKKEDNLAYGPNSLLGEDGDNGLLNVTGHSRVAFLDVNVHFTSHAEFR